jgi:hypothetical protein
MDDTRRDHVSHYDLLAAARRYRAGGTGPKATLMALVEHLGDHDGEWSCWPSQDALAHATEQTTRTVRRHVEVFVEVGLVRIEPRWTTGGRQSNRYVVDLDVLFEGAGLPDTMSATSTGHPEQVNRTPATPLPDTGDLLLHTKELEKSERKNDARADGDARAQFEDYFWPAYPPRNGRKIGKADALAQWVKLSIEDRRAALRGARIMSVEVDLGTTLPPDAHRWLRKRTWQDWQEPPTEATPKRRGGKQTMTEAHDVIARSAVLAREAGIKFDDDGEEPTRAIG